MPREFITVSLFAEAERLMESVARTETGTAVEIPKEQGSVDVTQL